MATIEQITPEVRPPKLDEPVIDRIEGSIETADFHVAYSVYLSTAADPYNVKLTAPGYFGIQPSYECFGAALAETDNNAIVIRPQRKQKIIKALHPNHLLKPLRLPSQVLRAVIKDSQNNFDFEEYDILAHSMGGPTAMHLTDNRPENIRSVLLIGSAGLDRHTPVSLGSKLPFAAREVIPAIPKLQLNRPQAARHILHYALANPLRTFSEGIAVGRSDIHESIAKARKLGIAVGRLQFKADPFFPVKSITDIDKKSVDIYEEFPDTKAGHLALLLHPQEVAEFSAAMIKEMTQG
jgi:hypothetical protein